MVESADPERVTFVLETVSGLSEERFSRLIEKYNLKENIIKVLQKYCDGGYGFEGEIVRSGHLQFHLMSSLIRMSRARPNFQELIDATSALELIT